MQAPTNILQTLATFQISDSYLLTAQLAEILNTELEVLNLISKCWGHGYVFTKDSDNSWSIATDDFVESDWFLNYSPLTEAS